MAATLCALALASGAPHAQTDPLPSWHDAAAKQAIVDFVRATTDKSSPKFVPQEERIATFDQDGTLWVEHPMYSQVKVGTLRQALYDEAKKKGWTVISMKNDWTRIFSFDN
jgi:hypothetical protein